MSFKKDGEIKVYKESSTVDIKNASQKERFTIDDLVEQSKSQPEDKKEESDVPDQG